MQIQRVTSSDWQTFFHLSQQYEAEFARITRKLPDAAGVYTFTDQGPHYEAWLAWEDRTPIGMAVVDTHRERIDLAEFYIIPARRHAGLGYELASQLFQQYPGDWQIRQIMGAEYAREFWQRVIRRYTQRPFTDTVEPDPEWGQVYIQRFQTKTFDIKSNS